MLIWKANTENTSPPVDFAKKENTCKEMVEMPDNKEQNYAFVIDGEGKPLSPTLANKAWYMVRVGKATLVRQYPLTIQLKRVILKEDIDDTAIVCGIDDGSKEVGVALVQKCKTKNKVIFKAVILQRQDVSKKMETRKGYRKNRRSEKKYRPNRFDNRGASKRKGRIPPSIKQKKEAIIRTVKRLNKHIRINKIILEDVAIDIRRLTEGRELYKWEYQKSNRLDENLRKATLYRDNLTCQMCSATDTMLEAHHINPKKYNGADSIYNLITLCSKCHDKVTVNELDYAEEFYAKIEGRKLNLKSAMHVMQGKHWLREELSKIAKLEITTGGDTANKRIDYDIEKSHSNDAICINGLLPVDTVAIKEYTIKPLRKKSKAKIQGLKGFRQRDLVKYIKRNGTEIIAYITSLRIKNNKSKSKVCNITTLAGETLRGYGFRNLTLLDRPNKIMFA